ncbi:MAG: ATP-binding protein [Candidatus Omnitrophota bacterium]
MDKGKKKKRSTAGMKEDVGKMREQDALLESLIKKEREVMHMEDALVESMRRFRDLFEQSPIGVGIHDLKGELLMVNRSYLEVFGLKSFSAVRQHKLFSDFKISAKDIEQLERGKIVQYEALYDRDKAVFTILKEGASCVLLIISPIFREEEIIGYMVQMQDISERKKVAESQRLAQLGQLLSEMAHEVNNPLMVISGRAELALLSKQADDKVKESLNVILEQCFLAKDVVQRLLGYSRLGKVETVPMDVVKILDLITGILEHHFYMSKITLKKNISPRLPLVMGNEKQLQEVFMNIARNSIEAMSEGGSVSIKAVEEKEFVRIDIRDTGEGMSQKVLGKVFEPFFTTKQNGTGLGMAVCYTIIKEHGGDLFYTSKVGEGTTATVLLPVARTISVEETGEKKHIGH